MVGGPTDSTPNEIPSNLCEHNSEPKITERVLRAATHAARAPRMVIPTDMRNPRNYDVDTRQIVSDLPAVRNTQCIA